MERKVRHANFKPYQARLKLKSIWFWQLLLSDPEVSQRRKSYAKNKIASYTPEDIAHLENLASQSAVKQKSNGR